jgi:hypothetical protein
MGVGPWRCGRSGRVASWKWKKQRLVVARREATTLGLDIRYVVTSLPGSAKYLYETVYCGQVER